MRVVMSNSSVKWGGVHVVTEMLARGLTERGHRVVVFGAPGSILEERMRGGVAFEPILEGMDLHPAAVWRAARALRRHRAEAVLALMKKDVRLTVPAAWSRGIPSVVRHANDRPLTGWLYDRLLFGALPALHIANSEATKRTLLRSAPWLRPDAISVIYNGVEPPGHPPAITADLGLPPGSLAVVFAGRLETRKGLLDLAAAWPRVARSVANAHIVIAGSGPDERRAREVFGDSPRVHWLGYRSDMASVLQVAHVAAVPSHWEGFGLIAVEAMLAGLPVVAARASSLPEIVEDGVHGILVPPRNPPALAAALIRLLRSPTTRERMGKAGRDRAITRFSRESMVDAYEAVLRSVVHEPA